MNYLKLDDFNFKNKTVILRVDLNSSIIGGKLEISDRMKAHSDTISELMSKGAKLVILAHQGRIGDPDYMELDEHTKIISELCGKRIEYVDDLFGETAVSRIKSLLPGQAIMLKNVRSIKEETAKVSAEEHNNTKFIKTLEKLADYFVLDAFSIAHRPQASVVGFTHIPNIAGRVMEAEIENISKAAQNVEHPYIMIMGGAKIDDYLPLIEHAVKTGMAYKILTSGILGEVCLMAQGIKLGDKEKFIHNKGFDKLAPKLKALMEKAPDVFETPIDLAAEENGKRKEILLTQLPTNLMPKDIGTKTALKYSEFIKQAKTIYLKGPAGAFEEENFAKGSKIIIQSIADATKEGAFSLAGGGQTASIIERFGAKKDISYMSLAGGALLEYLAGQELPGLKALEKSYEKFGK